MEKGSGTRSGMLWEVERILKECKELGNLPQVLLLENVPQLHSQENMPHFQLWIKELEKLGYQSYWQDLNAKNFGVPQNRDRCFMVSILGDFNYKMPSSFPLKYKLKDLLESNVDEKYYLSQQMIEGMMNTNFESYKLENKLQDPDGIANCIIARFEGTPQCIKVGNYSPSGHNASSIVSGDGIAPTQTTQCGSSTASSSILITEETKVINNLRIRKLTPKECWRLMGVKDEDFDNVCKNQSNSSLYHLAGDSIVTTCLMGLIGELLGIDYQTKITELTNSLKGK